MVRLKANYLQTKLPVLKLRTAGGVHLIELVAALLMAGILSVVLSSSLSQVIRLSTATDRNLLAANTAQEVIERIRSSPFEELPNSGTYGVQVNLGGTADTQVSASGGFLAQRPTMLDGTKLTWMASQADGNLPKNRFDGTVSVTFSDLPVASTKNVIVEVRWSDNAKSDEHVYKTGTVITRNGIMRHL
jgi:type II secretory pathway pseudopilin PulG